MPSSTRETNLDRSEAGQTSGGRRRAGCRRRTANERGRAADRDQDLRTAWRTVPSVRGDGTVLPDVALDVWVHHVRYARTRDDESLTELVEEYRPYALSLARRLHRHGESLEDLQQVALEALVVALNRFDPEQSLPFAAFATPTITGTLKRHFRDRGYALRIPRRLQETEQAVRAARDELTGSLGCEPTDDQIAEQIDRPVDDIREAARGALDRNPVSLDQPARPDGTCLDPGSFDKDLRRAEDIVALGQAMEHIDERSREVLALYFFEDLAQQAIADRFGVSQMQVSRWISKSLDELRQHLDAA